MDTRTNRNTERAEIREYLRPLLRRWWLVLGIAAAVTAVTYLHFAAQPERYTATTNLLIQSSSLNSVFTGQVNFSGTPERVANNQATLLQSEAVAAQAAKRLGFRGDPRSLLGAVSAAPVEETDFLRVSGTASSPEVAASIANAFARAFKEVNATNARQEADKAINAAQRELRGLSPDSREAESLRGKLERLQVLSDLPSSNVRLMDPALPPTLSAGPDPIRNAIFGFVVAILLAGGAAYALEALDRRIRRATDIEPLYGSPVLAELPHVRDTTDSVDGRLALPRPLTEAIRGLRTNLQLKSSLEPRLGDEPLRTILVASAVAGEGKSTVVRNLAIAYRESGMRVAVVDADLRKPSLSRLMVEDPVPGVLEVLTGAVSLDDALRTVDLHVEGLATIARVQEAMNLMQTQEPAEVRPVRAAPNPAPVSHAPSAGGALRRLMGGAATHSRPAAPYPAPAATVAPPAPVAPANGNGNGHATGNGNGAGGELTLLASGAAPADPGAVLASKRFQALLRELGERYDIVLLDSSPLLPVSDALPLLSAVDGVVVTSRVGVTTRGAARQVMASIRRVPGATVLGVVANDVKASESERNYGYGYGYGHYGGSGSTRGA